MAPPDARQGRPRKYDFAPLPGFKNRDAAYLAACLDELRERLIDTVKDLAPQALDFVPDNGGNSIATLCVHMASAEAGWVAKASGAELPADLKAAFEPGQHGGDGELQGKPPGGSDAQALTALIRRVRDEVTIPIVSKLEDIDAERPSGRGPITIRGVLMHMVWHWTYHSGQAGLLRRLGGPRYQWTFDKRLAGEKLL